MAINIQEILHPSDSDAIKFEKINYNFDQIVANGGGPTGQKGNQGAQGTKGNTGFKGQKGEQGIQGPQGEQGIQGEQGLPGSDASIEGVLAGGALNGTYPNPNLANGVVIPDSLSPMPGARVVRIGQTPLPVPNNALRNIEFSLESYDTDGFFDDSSPNSDIVIPREGVYLVVATVGWATAIDQRLVILTRIPAPGSGGSPTTLTTASFDSGNGQITPISYLNRFEEGQSVRLSIFQSSGSATSLSDSIVGGQGALSIQWFGP